MNIIKIIREEIEDFSWLESTQFDYNEWDKNIKSYDSTSVMIRDMYNNDLFLFLNSTPLIVSDHPRFSNSLGFRRKLNDRVLSNFDMVYFGKTKTLLIINKNLITILKDVFGSLPQYKNLNSLLKKWFLNNYNLKINSIEYT